MMLRLRSRLDIPPLWLIMYGGFTAAYREILTSLG